MEPQGEGEILILLLRHGSLEALRDVHDVRNEHRVWAVRANMSLEQSLHKETRRGHDGGAGDHHVPSRDAPLSKMHRAAKRARIREILEHTIGRVVGDERLRPSRMSRDSQWEENHPNRAGDHTQPLDGGAPRATEHPIEGAREGLQESRQMGVHEFGLAMPAEHELHASEQRGEDEIAVIEERFNMGGHRDVGELAGDPFRDEREGGTLRKWSALQDEASLEAFGELRWRLGDHTRIHELELELLMSQSVPLHSLDSTAGGFGGHFVHIFEV